MTLYYYFMGNESSKEPKQIKLKEEQIKIKGKFISGKLEQMVDKEVHLLMRNERGLLDKYAEDKRTIENILFKDELQYIAVSVNKIRAAKKLVLYFKFLESSARLISECNGTFENLPESSQASTINMAYASDYLDQADVREFGEKIKEYFRYSPVFFSYFSSKKYVDQDMQDYCEAVRYMKVSPKELAEYYISYMDRMNKEADPKVKAKLEANEYSSEKNLTPNLGFDPKVGNLPNQNFNGGLPSNGYPTPQNGNNNNNYNNNGFGGYSLTDEKNPPANSYSMNGHGAGFNPQPGNFGGYHQSQPPVPFQAHPPAPTPFGGYSQPSPQAPNPLQSSNPFEAGYTHPTAPPQGHQPHQAAYQPHQQAKPGPGGFSSHPSPNNNPFSAPASSTPQFPPNNYPQTAPGPSYGAYPAPGGANGSNNGFSANNNGFGGSNGSNNGSAPVQQAKTAYDDIFADPKVPVGGGFGGDKKDGGDQGGMGGMGATGDPQMDDFFKQLNELKKP